MTRSDKALYRQVFKDLFLLSCKFVCILISLALLGFVGFCILAVH